MCDSDKCLLFVSDVQPKEKRLKVFWHELAHAWQVELVISQTNQYDDEEMAELVSLGMSSMTTEKINEVDRFLTTGESNLCVKVKGHRRVTSDEVIHHLQDWEKTLPEPDSDKDTKA